MDYVNHIYKHDAIIKLLIIEDVYLNFWNKILFNME